MKAGVVIARKAIMPPPGVLRARNGSGDIFPFKFRRLSGSLSDRRFFSATDAGYFSGFLMVPPGSPFYVLWPRRIKSVKSVGAFESSPHTAFSGSISFLKQQTCPQLWTVWTSPLPLATPAAPRGPRWGAFHLAGGLRGMDSSSNDRC